MKSSTVPNGFSDVLAMAKCADCASWFRHRQRLSLYLDNKEVDRRTVIEVECDTGRVELRTLMGFDPVKDAWTDYCAPSLSFRFPDKRGRKALLEWVKSQAKSVSGWENPESFSVYKRTIAAAA